MLVRTLDVRSHDPHDKAVGCQSVYIHANNTTEQVWFLSWSPYDRYFGFWVRMAYRSAQIFSVFQGHFDCSDSEPWRALVATCPSSVTALRQLWSGFYSARHSWFATIFVMASWIRQNFQHTKLYVLKKEIVPHHHQSKQNITTFNHSSMEFSSFGTDRTF